MLCFAMDLISVLILGRADEPQASLSVATTDTDARMSPAFVPAAAAERPLSFSEKSKLRSDIMKAPQSHIDTIVSITREAASAQSVCILLLPSMSGLTPTVNRAILLRRSKSTLSN